VGAFVDGQMVGTCLNNDLYSEVPMVGEIDKTYESIFEVLDRV
jgi:hypothetical protein